MLLEEVPEFISTNLLEYTKRIPKIKLIVIEDISLPFKKLAGIESIIKKRSIIKDKFNSSFNKFATTSICYREFEEKHAVEYIILKYLEKQMMLIEMRRTIVFDKYIKDISENVCGIAGEQIKWSKEARDLAVKMLTFLQDSKNCAPIMKGPAKFIKFIALIKASIFLGEKLKAKDAIEFLALKLGLCIKISKVDIKTERPDYEIINESSPMVINLQKYEGSYWMLYERKEVNDSATFEVLQDEVKQFLKDNKEVNNNITPELVKYISRKKDENDKLLDENKLLSSILESVSKSAMGGKSPQQSTPTAA
jgi:hypothetical protein